MSIITYLLLYAFYKTILLKSVVFCNSFLRPRKKSDYKFWEFLRFDVYAFENKVKVALAAF